MKQDDQENLDFGFWRMLLSVVSLGSIFWLGIYLICCAI